MYNLNDRILNQLKYILLGLRISTRIYYMYFTRNAIGCEKLITSKWFNKSDTCHINLLNPIENSFNCANLWIKFHFRFLHSFSFGLGTCTCLFIEKSTNIFHTRVASSFHRGIPNIDYYNILFTVVLATTNIYFMVNFDTT
jgi:hypothetical protein